MTELRDQVDTQVHRWVRPDITSLAAYPVPDSTGLLKLDAMENPYGWPDALTAQWQAVLADAQVNRYPHPEAPGVKAALRTVMNIDSHWDILLGNGSDELIQLIAMAVSGADRTILAPEPSFVMYRMIARFLGMDYVGVPLTAEFELDLELTLSRIEREQPAVVFLAQPNNPTGNLWGDEKLRRIIEASPELSQALTAISSGVFSPDDRNRFSDLIAGLYDHDWFMVAADFDAYAKAQRQVDSLWVDEQAWYSRTILNTARVGWFSSDRTIRQYAKEIWKAGP